MNKPIYRRSPEEMRRIHKNLEDALKRLNEVRKTPIYPFGASS